MIALFNELATVQDHPSTSYGEFQQLFLREDVTSLLYTCSIKLIMTG